MDAVSPLAGTIPESVLHVLPDDLRHHHPGADLPAALADRMKFSAFMIFMVAVADHRLQPDRPLGMGRRLARSARRARLRRRHRRASERRYRGPRLRALCSASATGSATRTWRRTTSSTAVIGASLLWVGWFGFNAGSAVTANVNAGMAMAATQIATAAAALAWMFSEWMIAKKPSVLGIISGAVAGLVAITPASGFVNPIGCADHRHRRRRRLLSSPRSRQEGPRL